MRKKTELEKSKEVAIRHIEESAGIKRYDPDEIRYNLIEPVLELTEDVMSKIRERKPKFKKGDKAWIKHDWKVKHVEINYIGGDIAVDIHNIKTKTFTVRLEYRVYGENINEWIPELFEVDMFTGEVVNEICGLCLYRTKKECMENDPDPSLNKKN